MLTEELFAGLSIPAKVLYGVLLDRMTLSRKNAWFDEDNRVYIIYQIGEIQEDFGFSKKKAMDLAGWVTNMALFMEREEAADKPGETWMVNMPSGGIASRWKNCAG